MLRSYETTLISDDGSLRACILALQTWIGGGYHGSQSRMWLRSAGIGARDLAFPYRQEGLDVREALDRLAIRADSLDPGEASNAAYGSLIEAIWEEPFVLVESSPAAGKALGALASQTAVVYELTTTGGHPALGLVIEGAFVVIWFVAGPLGGLRRGLTKAVEEATTEVGTDVLKAWLRKRLTDDPDTPESSQGNPANAQGTDK